MANQLSQNKSIPKNLRNFGAKIPLTQEETNILFTHNRI